MTDSNQKLKKIRDQIDKIDHQILNLINARAHLAIEVGKVKRLEKSQTFYRPDREAQLYQAIIKRNLGPLTEDQA